MVCIYCKESTQKITQFNALTGHISTSCNMQPKPIHTHQFEAACTKKRLTSATGTSYEKEVLHLPPKNHPHSYSVASIAITVAR